MTSLKNQEVRKKSPEKPNIILKNLLTQAEGAKTRVYGWNEAEAVEGGGGLVKRGVGLKCEASNSKNYPSNREIISQSAMVNRNIGD